MAILRPPHPSTGLKDSTARGAGEFPATKILSIPHESVSVAPCAVPNSETRGDEQLRNKEVSSGTAECVCRGDFRLEI
jgi:hypothetical protein